MSKRLLLPFLLTVSCSGSVDKDPSAAPPGVPPTRRPPVGNSGPPAPSVQPPGATPGPMGDLPTPLRRLTRTEFNNTVRDLLGDASSPANALPTDPHGESGFPTASTVSAVDAERLEGVAAAVAQRAAQRLDQLLPCAAAADDACARQFIVTFGRRAYRRPLTADEVQDLFAFYSGARTQLGRDFRDAIRLLIQVMLQSPRFLYHGERDGTPAVRVGDHLKLTPHQLASRLSYFLWQSMPDDELARAADDNRLSRPEELGRQARRLLADSVRARSALATFATGWLELEGLETLQKDAKLFPTFSAELRAAMEHELGTFLVHHLLTPDEPARFETLLTGRTTWVDEGLARIYGVAGVTGRNERKVTLKMERAGLLTMPAVLATHAEMSRTSPVFRGKMLRERIISCERIPDPPPGVDTTPPAPTVGKSVRQQNADRLTNGACRGCHLPMDPLGYGLDSFDALGQHRTVDDGGNPLDTTGVITGLAGGDKPFAHAAEMARLLAADPQVQRCFIVQMARFALGRKETASDDAAIAALSAAFDRSGQDVRELLLQIVQNFAFQHRTPAAGEVLP